MLKRPPALLQVLARQCQVLFGGRKGESDTDSTASAFRAAFDQRMLLHEPLPTLLQFLCEGILDAYPTVSVSVVQSQPDGSLERLAGAGLWRARTEEGDLVIPLTAYGESVGALWVHLLRGVTLAPAAVQGLHALADRAAVYMLSLQDRERIRLQTAALDAAANAIVLADRDGRMLWVNAAWERLTGFTRADAMGQTPRLLKSGFHPPQFYDEVWQTILRGETWQGQMHNRRKDGSQYIDEQTITPVRDGAGAISHFIAIKEDVTDRVRNEEQLRFLALHDPITGAPNARMIRTRLQSTIARASHGQSGALILVQLDHFKLVNDTLGPDAGDAVLSTMASLLKHALRPGDLLARRGGDEFCAVVDHVDTAAACLLAERMRSAVQTYRFALKGGPLSMSASLGVVPIDGTIGPEAVVTMAVAAATTAKRRGRNQVVLGTSDEKDVTDQREASRWALRVREALHDNRLVLHSQPIVNMQTGRTEYEEVLLRLVTEEGELVRPGEFLPAAEQFHLMPEIDRWVLSQVVALLHKSPDRRLFVNLSGQSLSDSAMLVDAEALIRHSGIRPGQLILEVTETSAIRDLIGCQEWMHLLQELGCTFALDDFGTGFSSFAFLRDLPTDYVKIDGSFIKAIGSDRVNQTLVAAITTAAHTLGKVVVAEWVENREAALFLQDIGVRYGQGYYWGRPAPLHSNHHS